MAEGVMSHDPGCPVHDTKLIDLLLKHGIDLNSLEYETVVAFECKRAGGVR